ncbi:MAG: zinc-ribbon domain-containing protein [Methanobrevibacter sp.]|uniref:zinc-ribbon domain-containing protein n=1 Tax=Methanobrevibacter sp. TaxID=66852 RepID=UPI0026DF9BC5|nr:zinc-ribbon domain-containing protein [Methanobrevibacter sp.]MDO5849067.1 zinc-ribbon domain-containing protein [Methanobrevibacter sp.]
MIKCPRCGSKNKEGSKICSNCGYILNKHKSNGVSGKKTTPKRTPKRRPKSKRVSTLDNPQKIVHLNKKKSNRISRLENMIAKREPTKFERKLQSLTRRQVFLIVLIIAVVAFSAYYVFGDKTVDVGGVKFTVPNDFQQTYSDQIENYTVGNGANAQTVDYYWKVLENSKGDEISIDVCTPPGGGVFKESVFDGHAGKKVTINGHEGYYIEDHQYKYSFEFLKHGKIVGVRSNNLTFIKKVV